MKNLFWGYLDDNGKIYVKKYVNDRQIANYESLPFVKGIFDVFVAANIQQAKMMILERYKQELN